jgi:hypothetical protein
VANEAIRRCPRRSSASAASAVRGLEPAEDHVGMLDEHLARLGQHDAAGTALQQPYAGLALERGDLLRDRRGRVGEHVGGGRQRTAAGDFAEHAQAADVQHRLKVTARRARDQVSGDT